MSGPSNELARWFGSLPEARQASIVREFQAGMRELAADIRAMNPPKAVHQPFTGRHAHEHYDGSGGQHAHAHEHDNDADHGHDHDDLDAARRSAEAAKRSSRARLRPVVLNSASRARVDGAWARLAADAAAIERGRR